MTANHSSITVEQDPSPVPLDAGQSNLDLAHHLRDLAHWLEMHAADIPELWMGYLHFRNSYARSDTAREELTAVARALGDRATETYESGTVSITGQFGPVKVRAGAPIADLRDAPPEPEPPAYEPILKPVSLSDGLVEGALDLAGREGES